MCSPLRRQSILIQSPLLYCCILQMDMGCLDELLSVSEALEYGENLAPTIKISLSLHYVFSVCILQQWQQSIVIYLSTTTNICLSVCLSELLGSMQKSLKLLLLYINHAFRKIQGVSYCHIKSHQLILAVGNVVKLKILLKLQYRHRPRDNVHSILT